MGRSGRSKRHILDDEDEIPDPSPPSARQRRMSSSSSRLSTSTPRADDDNDDGRSEHGGTQSQFAFSQQIPEASQPVQAEKASERRNLDSMDTNARTKALLSLSRTILFKALDKEPIDRVKAIKDAGISADKISSAAYQEVANRFQNVFGFDLKRAPPFMLAQKSLPAKFKDRYYLVNSVQDYEDGSHSKAIHSVHRVAKIEKGVLILTLAIIFCKGENRSDGSRHLLARDLYRLMHTVDENIPEDPPAQGTARAKMMSGSGSGHPKSNRLQGRSSTPNLDVMLEHFTQSDYLIKEKATEENYHSSPIEEGDFLYSMGPRSALEIGRKQIITFCAEILGEEPDPTMLKEIEGDEDAAEVDNELFMEASQ